MPVHQTGLSGQAVVPCSHCNANDEGPEAGICHRHIFGEGRACYQCQAAANNGTLPGVFSRALAGVFGVLNQIPCSHCEGKGYRRV
jgi:hypothetical protein